jgi:hypothetical protein
VELLRRAWLLLPLAALSAGCMMPGALRNPRALGPGEQATRYGVASHYFEARRSTPHFTEGIQQFPLEFSVHETQGLGGGLDWDIGMRAFLPFDVGMQAGIKWQWLGAGEARSWASSLGVDARSLALFSPNDMGVNSLWAVPMGPVDLVLGGRYGWRFGHPEGKVYYERATGVLFLSPGDFWELQVAVQAAPGPGARPFAGLSIRRDSLPVHKEFEFGPMLRFEVGVELGKQGSQSGGDSE